MSFTTAVFDRGTGAIAHSGMDEQGSEQDADRHAI